MNVNIISVDRLLDDSASSNSRMTIALAVYAPLLRRRAAAAAVPCPPRPQNNRGARLYRHAPLLRRRAAAAAVPYLQ